MSRRLALLALLLLAAACRPRAASCFAGADPFDFLFMESGARQSALGGAFTAGRNDANVLAYNPAGLASLDRNHASFMHTSQFQSVQRERIAAALRSGFGLSFDRLTFGEIGRTTLSNPSGAGTSGFQPAATVIAAGIGITVFDGLTTGAAIKYIRQTIDDTAGAAWAGDLGLQAVVMEEPGLVLGLAVQHIGTKVRFQSQSEPLPLNVRGGAALSLPVFGVPVGVSLDLNKASERELVINAGAAATFYERFVVRFGQNTRNDAGPGFSFGFGLILKDYGFDYALVPCGELGASHQISLGMRWGQ
ncbi:MAG: PorV/PorQ family protein [Elusimicrobiota bacterium]